MATPSELIQALEEQAIAKKVEIPYQKARATFRGSSGQVRNWQDFEQVLGSFYIHMHRSVYGGKGPPQRQAASRAKDLLDRWYGEVDEAGAVAAYQHARLGTASGLRGVLDAVATSMSQSAVQAYVLDMFDMHVAPSSPEQKVRIIREFLQHFGAYLPESVRHADPRRYAQDYEPLLRAYVKGLRKISRMFRRL